MSEHKYWYARIKIHDLIVSYLLKKDGQPVQYNPEDESVEMIFRASSKPELQSILNQVADYFAALAKDLETAA